MRIAIDNLTDVLRHLDGIEAVVFDLDDTLYPEQEYVASGFRQIAASFPQIPQMAEKLWAAFACHEKAIDAVLLEAGCFTEENLRQCLSVYRGHSPDIHLYPQVEALLRCIRASGRKLGLISDGRPAGQWAKIRRLGLDAWMDRILITDELGGTSFRKPNPAAFIQMAAELSVPVSAMAYVADNPAKDFIAPESLGMRSIWFQNPEGLYYRQ